MSADPLVARLRAAGCVFAEEEAALLRGAAADDAALEALVARRVAGEPLEPLLGWVEFSALRIEVVPGVFVPRRRTEALVTEAVRLAREVASPVIVDLCCGVGAIGAAVAAGVAPRPLGRLVAADIDPLAVEVARRNLRPFGGEAVVGDLFAALPGELAGFVDLLVVNAPYVPTADIGWMPREAREHEPMRTLDGGTDGLDVHRRVAAGARDWLVPGGRVLIETSEAQAGRTADALAEAGLTTRIGVDAERGGTYAVGTAPR
ncbi:putative protein N(5)-glutamine methyltransferase [Agromyces sp. G08B096]|uniref:peptide chain release factor N(5)-glutamine methyltransferase n=1 Tax=Agromyces sp. G08B096 TaxID=3156399 RepID=A0AAU7WAH8_9MICO